MWIRIENPTPASASISSVFPIRRNWRLLVRISAAMSFSEKRERYKPGPDFEEVKKEQLLNIDITDSTELWLIQWPLNQLKPGDFEGKELSLKLNKDGNLGFFESSSGKSYEVMSVGTKEPDATVFLPSESESAIVGKISRRVCLVRYPDPKELEKPRSINTYALSNQKRKGYSGKTNPNYSPPTKSEVSKMTYGASHETQASAPKSGQGSIGSSSHKKRRNDGTSEGGSSQATGMATTGSESQMRSSSEKKKKKKEVKVDK